MENLTIGEISNVLLLIVGLISSVEFMVIRVRKLLDKKLNEIRDELKEELKNERIDRLKSDLVSYMALAEQGLLIGKQTSRAYEAYDLYTKKFEQNSYIHTEWERLKKEGKL